MHALTLDAANAVIAATLTKARDLALKPMGVVVLDARGTVKAVQMEDGASLRRYDIAHGKAYGALALGMGSRAIFKRAQEQAYFVDAVGRLTDGAMVPVPGGVLVKTADGTLIGAVGVSGDTSDNDEIAAIAGIEAAGLVADAG